MSISLGIQLDERVELAARAAPAGRRRSARRHRSGPGSGRSSRSRPPGRAHPPRSRWPASRAISARILLAQRAYVVVGGPAAAEPAPRQPGRAQRAATRRRRGPRRRRRRSRASRRRCRRRRAGRPTSRTSGVRPGTSGGPRPPRRAPRAPRRLCFSTWASTSSELTESRTAEVAKPSISSQPLSSAIRDRGGTEVREGVDALLGDRAVLVEVLGQAQRLLVRGGREGGRAAVCVDHQQVAGVGSDVEDAQAHACHATRPGWRH